MGFCPVKQLANCQHVKGLRWPKATLDLLEFNSLQFFTLDIFWVKPQN